MMLAKPDSKINGVQIGAITYSFRSIPDPEDIIKAYVTIGLSEAELMSNHAEQLAGAPPAPPPPAGGGRGRGEMTPEQQAEAQKAAAARAEEMRKWRSSISMDKFKDVRKKFTDQGIDVRLLDVQHEREHDEGRRHRLRVPAREGARRTRYHHLDAGQHGETYRTVRRQVQDDGRFPRPRSGRSAR